jgi:glycosyltransferase involved in cell wall biosynthesis
MRSPAMQSMLRALPLLLAKGWEIEVWCLESDPVDSRAIIRKFPRIPALRVLELHWFWLAAWLRLLAGRVGGCRWNVIHLSGPNMPGADVISLHFHARTWLGLIEVRDWKEMARWILTLVATLQEAVVLRFSHWSVLLPVSRGLASRVERCSAPNREVQVLPNALDTGRFNPAVKTAYRTATRAALAARPDDFIFLFASMGHYRRKGFWTAVQVLGVCREFAAKECGLRLRLVVIGTSEAVQGDLGAGLDVEFSDWREWISFQPPCDDIERWYAAADAFIFPSIYETFSLVSLEASACGLPLLLTAFDGQEMYLRDGVNGFLLPWEPELMPAKIQHFLKIGRHQLEASPAEVVDVCAYAESLDRVYRRIAHAV